MVAGKQVGLRNAPLKSGKRKSGKRKREQRSGDTLKTMKTELEGRTKKFAVQIVRLTRSFPRTVDGIEVGRQLLRSGTSIGANYREANRAESKDDFIHKVGVAEKEASETVYWLEICTDASLGNGEEVHTLLKEANELLAIVSTIGRKAKNTRRMKASALLVVILGALSFSLSAFPLSAFLR
jgi:four helix bundle protein